jgi:hypothetical protein
MSMTPAQALNTVELLTDDICVNREQDAELREAYEVLRAFVAQDREN